MEEIKYIPNNNLHNRGYIGMHVTNGIEIKDKNYIIVEYKIIGESLYAILTRDFVTYYKQLLTGISDQETFDDTELRNRISRLENLPQYRYDDSYLRGEVGEIKDHSTEYESTTNTRLELIESKLVRVGRSAYDLWLSLGNTGTEQDFINSLKGEKGDKGDAGAPSAYDIWLSLGNRGTEQDFINSLKGEKGDKGDVNIVESVYDVWLELGNHGTKQDFINSLKGEKGDKGDVTDIGTHALVKSTVNITNTKTPLYANLDHYKTLTYNTKSQLGILHLDIRPTEELGQNVIIGSMTEDQPKPYSLIETSVMGNNTDGVGQIYVKTTGEIMCNYLKANTRYTVDLIGYFE